MPDVVENVEIGQANDMRHKLQHMESSQIPWKQVAA